MADGKGRRHAESGEDAGRGFFPAIARRVRVKQPGVLLYAWNRHRQ